MILKNVNEKFGNKKGGVSKWQAKDKEETQSIGFYIPENPSGRMENTSTNTWWTGNRSSFTVGDLFRQIRSR
jgi:hypothetical protein